MSNQPIAELLANKLREGIVHPGDPGQNKPPTAVQLPIFRSTGQPKEVADLQNVMAQTLAEAVVHTIESEGDCVIVSTATWVALQRELASVADVAPHKISVHCQCDRNRQNPLLLLTTRGQQTVVIDEKQVQTLLSRNPQCPHKGEK